MSRTLSFAPEARVDLLRLFEYIAAQSGPQLSRNCAHPAALRALLTPERGIRRLRMRFVLPIACALAAIAGQATAASKFAPDRAGPAVRPAQTLRADAPAETQVGMLGASTGQIRAKLGAPDVAHNEGRGAFWTYRLPECALFVFFQDEGKGLKVSGLSSGPRRRGQAQASTEDCLTAAESR